MAADPVQVVVPIMAAVSDVGYNSLKYSFPGLVINILVEGVIIAMYVAYIVRPNHPWWEAWAVSACLAATTFVSCCYVAVGWNQMVRGYARPEALFYQAPIMFGEGLIGTTICSFASCVYATRLFALTGNKLWIKLVTWLLLFFKWCLTIGIVVIVSSTPKITASFFDPALAEQGAAALAFTNKWMPYIIIDSSAFIVLELILCVATIIMIQRERARATYKKTQSLLIHILLVSARSLVIPVVFYTINTMLLGIGDKPQRCMVIASVLPKTAIFSLLMLYKDRDTMRLTRSAHNTVDGVEIRMDTVQHTSPGVLSMGGNDIHTFRGLHDKYKSDKNGNIKIEVEQDSIDEGDPYSSKEKLSAGHPA